MRNKRKERKGEKRGARGGKRRGRRAQGIVSRTGSCRYPTPIPKPRLFPNAVERDLRLPLLTTVSTTVPCGTGWEGGLSGSLEAKRYSHSSWTGTGEGSHEPKAAHDPGACVGLLPFGTLGWEALLV